MHHVFHEPRALLQEMQTLVFFICSLVRDFGFVNVRERKALRCSGQNLINSHEAVELLLFNEET